MIYSSVNSQWTVGFNNDWMIIIGGKGGGGAQSRIPLFSPTFWNSYPAYQKNPISNPPYPISFPNLQIPHTKKFNDKILHTKKNERQILLSRFFIWAPKCSVIYSPQLFTDYKEAKGIHLSPFWKCCLAKGNSFIFHSYPAFKSGKVAILHTS